MHILFVPLVGHAGPSDWLLAASAVLIIGDLFAHWDIHWRASRKARPDLAEAEVVSRLQHAKEHAPAIHARLAAKQEPPWFEPCSKSLAIDDAEAEQLQASYHSSVTRCIAVLSTGVIILAVNEIAIKGWWSQLYGPAKTFVTLFELVATVYAIGFFFWARHTNALFVRKRAIVESLRSWLHLALLFPLEQGRTVEDAFESEKAYAHSIIIDTPAAYWAELARKCTSLGLRPDLAPASLAYYLAARPVGQLGYFMKAQGRIHASHLQRERTMIALYAISVLLAIYKALALFTDWLPARITPTAPGLDWLSTALLAVMVLSAAATSALISRNERSLLHAYHSRERRIGKWFAEAMPVLAMGDPAAITGEVLEFEEIMLNDLLDFMHITSRDIIEVPGL